VLQPYDIQFDLDGNGKPAGGCARAVGLEVTFQNGPLGAPGDPNRQEPNGAFVETLIAIARDRIQWYNDNGFGCRENSCAITKLDEALHWLNARTARRTDQGVEGTHKGN